MVSILTGLRESGKSTRFFKLYKEAEESGAGIFSVKKRDSLDCTIGYDLFLLPIGSIIPFARLSTAVEVFAENDRLMQGQYVFSKSAFLLAYDYVLSEPFTTVWIDEVGKLEIRGLGFSILLKQLLSKNINLNLVVRDIYLSEILCQYSIAYPTLL